VRLASRLNLAISVDQKHLLFRANARHSALDAAVFEHKSECTKVFEQRLHESVRLVFVNVLFDLMFSHLVPVESC
jgi:hypothetical protein